MTLRSSLRLAVFTLTFVAPAFLTAQQPDPLHTATRQELNIIKVLIAQENAWNKGDLTAFASGFKDSPTPSSLPIRSPAASPDWSTSTNMTTPTKPPWVP